MGQQTPSCKGMTHGEERSYHVYVLLLVRTLFYPGGVNKSLVYYKALP